MINRIQIEEVEKKDKTIEIMIAELNVLGGLDKDETFIRGIDSLPTLNCEVYLIDGEKMNKLLGIENEESDKEKEHKNFRVGIRPIKGAGDVYLNLDKLLGRHVAILGTTGSGKSCTVASIVQSMLKQYPYPRLLFFDIHNEYPSAFEGEWKNKTKCIPWNDFSLPYWFLDLQEFIAIYHGGNAGSNQGPKLKEWIIELKKNEVAKYASEESKLYNRISVDSPIYFDIEDLIKKIDEEISKANKSDKNTFEKMKLKIEDINNDNRYNFLKKDKENKKDLAQYFIELLGLCEEENKYLNILDLSGIPSEIRTVCIGVLERLCFDYSYWDIDPENLPLSLVLEEAHNYIPDEDGADFNLCKKRIEKIAKEGRKYGIGLIVVSQRPSNVSTTVLSQCGTFIALRLTNDIDQNKIKKLLPDVLGEQANVLPSLKDGEALVSGDAIKLPGKVYFFKPNPEPKSNDVRYHHSWSIGIPSKYDVNSIILDWKERERKYQKVVKDEN
ncbi:hypothetical protein CBO05C_2027 [Clostridium botulinum B str. Osaka05]|uniref:Helicase HerA central domain-containing protein n=1 Tax=Clostridium botulinum B str. Osaka05 TaxID=1407017 RepID=A0A0S6U351_CLOBO|nr:ATP-binding protein [Clostridium botulinum]GAE02337.1 hypothetical protein CBO05C_2027 [Clostridium botulinum B str. Osaka05]